MKKKASGEKITIEHLAGMVSRGFESADRKSDERFSGLEKRFDGLEKRLDTFETETKDSFKKIRNDILDIGDKFVPRHEFDILLIRVSRLEQKVKEKVG